MTWSKIVEWQSINSNVKNKDIVQMEVISPETLPVVADQSYWKNNQELDANIALRNLPSGWSTKTIRVVRAATVWTWLQSFTWFWFTPTSCSIIARRAWNTTVATWSLWWYNSEWYCLQLADWGSNDVSWSWYVVRVFYANQWWDRTSATFNSFDTDWITLNFNYSVEDIVMEITCYS